MRSKCLKQLREEQSSNLSDDPGAETARVPLPEMPTSFLEINKDMIITVHSTIKSVIRINHQNLFTFQQH